MLEEIIPTRVKKKNGARKYVPEENTEKHSAFVIHVLFPCADVPAIMSITL